MIIKLNKLTDIPAAKYEGYIWYSDQQKPVVLNGDQNFSFDQETQNPFVIEAMLFDKEKNISIMIKHTGQLLIYQYDLNNIPKEAELEKVEYLPHRLDGVEKVKFTELWLPEKDEFCENMDVLKMKALIFTGFKY